MPKPLVAIVGRPNVGKSMLFNKLTGRRAAIVEDTPGVTRDRIYGDCDWNGREFELVDTGGIEPNTDSEMLQFMRRQAELAIAAADVIVMVTDVKTGVTAADQDVANMLLRSRKPVCLAVNKCDSVGPTNPRRLRILCARPRRPHRGLRRPRPRHRRPARLVRCALPRPLRAGGRGRGHQRCHHWQAERRQIQPAQPHSRAGARHCLQCRRNDARCHRQLF